MVLDELVVGGEILETNKEKIMGKIFNFISTKFFH